MLHMLVTIIDRTALFIHWPMLEMSCVDNFIVIKREDLYFFSLSCLSNKVFCDFIR